VPGDVLERFPDVDDDGTVAVADGERRQVDSRMCFPLDLIYP
jgi:hypothetical protein